MWVAVGRCPGLSHVAWHCLGFVACSGALFAVGPWACCLGGREGLLPRRHARLVVDVVALVAVVVGGVSPKVWAAPSGDGVRHLFEIHSAGENLVLTNRAR